MFIPDVDEVTGVVTGKDSRGGTKELLEDTKVKLLIILGKLQKGNSSNKGGRLKFINKCSPWDQTKKNFF